MLCIKNGILVSGEGTKKEDLWISDGKISEARPTAAAETINAEGCYVFPGFIDAHTHFQMNSAGEWTADDFASGTMAALAGGTTTILDFATQEKGGSLREALDTWHSRARGQCSCDYGFHMAVTDWNPDVRGELEDMLKSGVSSVKAYMAYDHLRISDDDLRELMEAAGALGMTVGAHCELGDAVNENREKLLNGKMTGVRYHPASRPPRVESMAVKSFLALAGEANAKAWVVHLSTSGGLNEIVAARGRGQTVIAEVCPQYFTLTDKVYIKNGFEGAKYVCSPPIRSARNKNKLINGIREGEVDIISTDHCSFNFNGQKELGREDFSRIPNGLPAVEHRASLTWSIGALTAQRFCALMSENPAKIFGMYPQKGSLLPGADADVVVWDPDARWVIRAADQRMKADYSPWEGAEVKGRAKYVLLHGELCALDGGHIKPWRGRYVSRNADIAE